MGYTFGFDLGTNSLGWAVVDKKQDEIAGMGSVVFPMGVNLEKGSKEVSKNQVRREKRQIRRQIFRRSIRKAKLAELLWAKGMFPDIPQLYQRYCPDGKDKAFSAQFQLLIRQIPLSKELNAFFQINPYAVRAKAYRGEKLSLLELGRVFYQFGLRRGYRETLQDGDEKGVLYSGKPGEGKTGIDETLAKVEEFGTLGNYLFHENAHETRLRNRYTLRSMYTAEFDLIYNNQKQFYPEVLTEALYNQLGYRHQSDSTKNGILFFQRPLRSQKHLLGNCSFERSKPVAPKSCPDFEYFRAWTYATNIRANGTPLSQAEQESVVEFLIQQNKARDFLHLRKKLADPQANYNYDDKEKLPASQTLGGLRKALKKHWKKLDEKALQDLWHLKYWAEDPEWLSEHLHRKYGFSQEEIGKFKKFRLAEGYASLSRKAMRNILFFMRKGYPYDEAVVMAGVKEALREIWDAWSEAKKAELEDNIIGLAKDGSTGPAIERVKAFLRDQFELQEKHLRRLYHHSFKESAVQDIYLPAPDNVRNPIVQQALFVLRRVYNELVEQYGPPEAVKVELARELKSSKKERDRIRQDNRQKREVNIEIKKVLDQYNQAHSRENIQKLQLFNELKDKYGKVVNPFKPEQTFGLADLFGRGTVQVEHIMPRSRSLNDSLANKTLCDADTNRAKGDRTPFEYYRDIGADWDQIKKHIFKILPYQKAKRFIQERIPDAEEFISRQLNDTRYISRVAVGYLRQSCQKVDIMQGSVSATLRHHWGLDGILNPSYPLEVPNGEYLVAIDAEAQIVSHRAWGPELKKIEQELAKRGKVLSGNVLNGTFYPRKDRQDHRHHALDALVVALAERKHLQKLSTAHAAGVNLRDLKKEQGYVVPRPWKRFWEQARQATDAILVYHQANNRVLTKISKRLYDGKGRVRKNPKTGEVLMAKGMAARGALHKESVYGLHQNRQGETAYHIRKPVDFIENHKHLAKVVDPGVRRAIAQRLEALGVAVNDPKGWKISDLPKEKRTTVFFEADAQGRPQPQIFLPNAKGAPVPIKKVRIREEIGNAMPLKEGVNQYVNPKNNHHVLIYTDGEGKLQEEVVSLWTAVDRARKGQAVYQTPAGGELWFTMEENDLFLLGLANHQVLQWPDLSRAKLSEHLFRVQKLSAGYYVFRQHRASSIDYDSEMKRIASMKALQEANPVKVKISITGNIEPW